MTALILALVLTAQPVSPPPMPMAEYPVAPPPAPEAVAVRETPVQRAPAPSAEVSAERAAPVTHPKQNGVSIQLAAHVGLLAVDFQVGRFYGFAAGNVGIPLLSDGQVGAVTAGMGYSFILRETSEVAWHMDLLALGNFMWLGQQPMGGFGVGMGFRMVHASGFTMGFKIPALGGEMGVGYGGTQIAVAYFFLANAIALPVFSVGYRF